MQKHLWPTLYIIVCLIVFAFFTLGQQVEAYQVQSINLRLLQGLQVLNTVIAFVIPTLAFVFLYQKRSFQYLNLHKAPNLKNVLLVTASFLIAIPAIGYLAELNNTIVFPKSLSGLEQSLRASEEAMQVLTLYFLDMKSVSDLLINVFIIGFVAALTEELFFRGMVQRHFQALLKRPHLAIWITAILFSALHGQFFGFFPRMLLGAMLGYVYYFSSNLWLSVLGHFINNGVQVIITYFMLQEYSLEQLKDMQIGSDQPIYALLAGLLSVVLLVYFTKDHTLEKLGPSIEGQS